jgi:hypothetical protein
MAPATDSKFATMAKFSESKLKADLSNYMDWSDHMTTFLKRLGLWTVTFEAPTKNQEGKVTVDQTQNIEAYFNLEANCEADTRRTYLKACNSSAWEA